MHAYLPLPPSLPLPQDLIAIFTPSELELLSCGLPSIDLDDLKSHTELHHWRTSDKEIQWFWEVSPIFSFHRHLLSSLPP